MRLKKVWGRISIGLGIIGLTIGGIVMINKLKTVQNTVRIYAKKDGKEVKINIVYGSLGSSMIQFTVEDGGDTSYSGKQFATDTREKVMKGASFIREKKHDTSDPEYNSYYYFAGPAADVNVKQSHKIDGVEVTEHTPIGQDNGVSNYHEVGKVPYEFTKTYKYTVKWYPPQMVHIDVGPNANSNRALHMTVSVPLIQIDKVAISCKGYKNHKTAPELAYSERKFVDGSTVLGIQNLLPSGSNSQGRFIWFTKDDLNDVKTIYGGMAISYNYRNTRWSSVSKVELNTVQPHEEYNINKYISKLFNIAHFDKIIPNFDSKGKPMASDRATFILATNGSKLPCVEKVSSLSESEMENITRP